MPSATCRSARVNETGDVARDCCYGAASMPYAVRSGLIVEGLMILKDVAKSLREADGHSPTQSRHMSGLLCRQWDSALQYQCLMAWRSPRTDG